MKNARRLASALVVVFSAWANLAALDTIQTISDPITITPDPSNTLTTVVTTPPPVTTLYPTTYPTPTTGVIADPQPQLDGADDEHPLTGPNAAVTGSVTRPMPPTRRQDNVSIGSNASLVFPINNNPDEIIDIINVFNLADVQVTDSAGTPSATGNHIQITTGPGFESGLVTYRLTNTTTHRKNINTLRVTEP